MVANLGTDSWARDCRETIRSGLRSRNLVDFGGLRVWLINTTVAVTDGDNLHAYELPCASAADAVLEMGRITRAIEAGQDLPTVLGVPASKIPPELMNAWIH